jgi:hypothetical protein
MSLTIICLFYYLADLTIFFFLFRHSAFLLVLLDTILLQSLLLWHLMVKLVNQPMLYQIMLLKVSAMSVNLIFVAIIITFAKKATFQCPF